MCTQVTNNIKKLCEKGVLRNFTKSTGKHLCQRLFNKVAGLRLAASDFTSFADNAMFQKIQLKEFGRFSGIQMKASLDKYHFLSSSKCQIDIA